MDDPKELGVQLLQTNEKMLEVQQKIIDATVTFQRELRTLQEQDQNLREAIKAGMEQSGTKSYEDDNIKIVYVKPTERTTVDTGKLKLLYPEAYDETKKVSQVKGSVRISLKNEA